MTKKVSIIVVIVVLASATFFVFSYFSSPEIRNAPARGEKIVAFGDSLVQGVGASEGKDFVSLVSGKIGRPIDGSGDQQIVNLGKSGDTTRSALTRLDLVLAKNPDVVILLLGGNDYLQRLPKEETFQNLETIVNTFHESGVAVLLLGIRGGAVRDTYKSDFDDFARTHKTGYVSNVLDGLLGDKEFMYDQIHPNDAGYEIIAERVAEKLREIL